MRYAVLFVMVGCGGAQLLPKFLDEQGIEPTQCGLVEVGAAGDCADEGAALGCFQAAWDACTPAQLDIGWTSIEGDPIYETLVVWDDGGTCQVERFFDSSEDAFAGPGPAVKQYTCSDFGWTEDPEACDAFGAHHCRLR